MQKILMICNTPYQIFVATWLKFTEFCDDSVDIIVSDHMVGGMGVYENIRKTDVFNNEIGRAHV